MKRTGFMDSESALFIRNSHAKRSNLLNVQAPYIQRVAHCNRLLRHYGIYWSLMKTELDQFQIEHRRNTLPLGMLRKYVDWDSNPGPIG